MLQAFMASPFPVRRGVEPGCQHALASMFQKSSHAIDLVYVRTEVYCIPQVPDTNLLLLLLVL